jgi:hypothetical protein
VIGMILHQLHNEMMVTCKPYNMNLIGMTEFEMPHTYTISSPRNHPFPPCGCSLALTHVLDGYQTLPPLRGLKGGSGNELNYRPMQHEQQ